MPYRENINENMTTQEIFRAWDDMLDDAGYLLTSVCNRLRETGYDPDSEDLTEEQEMLLDLEETLESLGLME